MSSFEEIVEQMDLIKDIILSNIIHENDDQSEMLELSKHLLITKQWFVRVSWAHKKQFVLSLVDEVRSVRTLCLLLKSIWNCRPKDAAMSAYQHKVWSRFDQVPMDHDRTAVPLSFVKNSMSNDREWFRALKPDFQNIVLSELLSIAGGPILWEVLHHAKLIYEKHQEEENLNLIECVVINEPPAEKKVAVPEPIKKEPTSRRKSSFTQVPESKQTSIPGHAQRELENNLAVWASTIKTLKDSMKLEELEFIYKDGSKRKMWKANRPKPEVDTVDFIQLLPSTISKRIFSYLPTTQLVECGRVNKYWAYLVDEIRAEVAARQKIDVELEKLRENMVRHDASLGLLNKPEFAVMLNNASEGKTAKARASAYKSKQYCSYPLKTKKKTNKSRSTMKPIRNMTDLNEQLERRGAADQNIWNWCENLFNIYRKYNEHDSGKPVKLQENLNFLCPSSKGVQIPLHPPLVVDPTHNTMTSMKLTSCFQVKNNNLLHKIFE